MDLPVLSILHAVKTGVPGFCVHIIQTTHMVFAYVVCLWSGSLSPFHYFTLTAMPGLPGMSLGGGKTVIPLL